MNKVFLVARTAGEIQIKETGTGKKYTRFNVAINAREKADFVPCIAWEKTAEFLANYVKKGQRIAIDGRLTTWKGEKGVVMEVIAERVEFADGKEADV